jgi:hypothetical protein
LLPFATSSAPAGVSITVGVPHDGISSRDVFHTSRPSSTSYAARNESLPASHWTITVPRQRIGELPKPHWYSAS